MDFPMKFHLKFSRTTMVNYIELQSNSANQRFLSIILLKAHYASIVDSLPPTYHCIFRGNQFSGKARNVYHPNQRDVWMATINGILMYTNGIPLLHIRFLNMLLLLVQFHGWSDLWYALSYRSNTYINSREISQHSERWMLFHVFASTLAYIL